MRGALSIVTAALALSSPALADDGFRTSTRLSPIASGVTGRPVTVWCARTPVIWRDAVQALYPTLLGSTRGLAGVPDADSMQLAPWVCQTLEGWLRGKNAPSPENLGREILTLVHESIHLRGVVDEGLADCAALPLVPGVARTSFKIRSAKVLRAVVQAAWADHNGKGAAYRGPC